MDKSLQSDYLSTQLKTKNFQPKRVLVLGNLPLATKIIKLVSNHPAATLVGVIAPEEEKEYPTNDGEICASKYASRTGITRFTNVDEIGQQQGLDLAISARNNAILRPWFLEKFNFGVINCHGGYIPDYKGVGGHIFPIINGERYSGGTIHWMTKEVDAGDVIDRRKVPISSNETGASLFIKINNVLYSLLEENFEDLLNERAPRIPQNLIEPSTKSGKTHFYYKKDVDALFNSNVLTENMQRAIYWPGKT